MCGIAGIYSKTSFDKQLIETITNTMPHRGPDAAGFYCNDKNTVALGHRRLSIIDLSTAANQPMYSHCKKHVMVFNGEIFNYLEIAADLNISFNTHSDTEVILEAFARWGVDFVHKLNGMFLIAIYTIETNELFLFRDRLGVKPLYYSYENEQLFFGSELKAVVAGMGKKNLSINKNAVYEFLHLG
jgi:asparagine synthase (glutamine-hydrolysing)